MSIIVRTRAAIKPVHLTICMLVEKLRHSGEPATPLAIAAHIQGAPIKAVRETMDFMVDRLQVLDKVPDSYALNQLGAEVTDAEIEGWTCSPFEQARRDAMNRSAQAGSMRIRRAT